MQAVAAVIGNTKGDQAMVQTNLQKYYQIIQEGILGPGIVHRCGSDELLQVNLNLEMYLILKISTFSVLVERDSSQELYG